MINITELSEENLEQLIENTKAECEKRASALKKYEQELERRKQGVQLGVPLGEGRIFGNIQDSFKKIYTTITLEEVFESIKSSEVFFERLKTWLQEYTANARGELIEIKVLLPLLPKGWVACFEDGEWAWFKNKPELFGKSPRTYWCAGRDWCKIKGFNIKPAEDWRNSLMECGI